MEILELKLPKFTFIDHIGYDDPEMRGRCIIMHVPTLTLMELLIEDYQEFALKHGVKTYKFECTGERLMLALHFSYNEEMVDEIFEAAANWYRGYADWEDNVFGRYN